MPEHDCVFITDSGFKTLFCQVSDDCPEYNPEARLVSQGSCDCCHEWVDAEGEPIACF